MSLEAIEYESDHDSFHSCEVISDVEMDDCENNASARATTVQAPSESISSLPEELPQRRHNRRIVLDEDLPSDSEAEEEQQMIARQPQKQENHSLINRIVVEGKTYILDFSYEPTESGSDDAPSEEEEERDENDPRVANYMQQPTTKTISAKTTASNNKNSISNTATQTSASIYFDEEAQEASASEDEASAIEESVMESETLATFKWSSGSKDWTISSTTTKYRLPRVVGDSLYDYQRDGVSFLLGVWESTMNAGILADDMGLGKTNQTVAAICTLFSSMRTKNCLVISPLAVMEKWRSLLANQLVHAGQQVYVLHGPNKDKVLNSFKARGSCGVLVSTYETCQSNSDGLAKIGWDVLVADEASKIKNHKSQMFKSLRVIAAASKRRLCITGTPFENNLGELWALFDFACDGKLFGPYEYFKRIFASKIERSQYRGQSDRDRVVGAKLSKALSDAIKPYILRREKSILLGSNRVAVPNMEIGENKSNVNSNARETTSSTTTTANLPSNQSESKTTRWSPNKATNTASLQTTLEVTAPNRPVFNSRKVDLLVWIQLSESQRQTYKAFLESEEVALALNQTQSPLAALTVLKKICDDKRLVKLSSSISASCSLAADPYESSSKLKVLMGLLADVVLDGGHKVLIFSHSKAMLEYIEKAMERRFRGEVSCLRVDGDVKVQERMRRIKAFNRDEELDDREFNGKWDVLLLTSGVGALGIEVTGANRVVIFDPHWNPAVDDQAIDRAFRIGQTRNVVCYRLVTLGTVEEKMTRIQLKKTALARVILNGETQRAFSSREDLKDLFTLSDSNESNSLMRVIEETATETAWESVKKRLEGSTEREIAEMKTQLSALGASPDDESELNVAHLARQNVICGVSDRIALFTREHMDELGEAMRAMSTDDQNMASKVVKDAMGWLVKKNKT